MKPTEFIPAASEKLRALAKTLGNSDTGYWSVQVENTPHSAQLKYSCSFRLEEKNKFIWFIGFDPTEVIAQIDKFASDKDSLSLSIMAHEHEIKAEEITIAHHQKRIAELKEQQKNET